MAKAGMDEYKFPDEVEDKEPELKVELPEDDFNIEIEDTDTVVGDGWNPAELGSTIISGNGLGFARSVQLKIYNNSGFPWSVDGITYKYSPRSIKT